MDCYPLPPSDLMPVSYLYCTCFSHPSFHRRCYWLLDSPRIILVHYLDTGTPAPTIHVPIPPAPKLLSKSCKADVGVSKEAKAKVSKTGSAPARKGSKNSATTAGGAGHRCVFHYMHSHTHLHSRPHPYSICHSYTLTHSYSPSHSHTYTLTHTRYCSSPNLVLVYSNSLWC